MKLTALGALILTLLAISSMRAQTTPEVVAPILQVPLEKPEVVRFQLLNHLLSRAAPLKVPPTSQQWTAQAKRLRTHLLNESRR